MRGAAVAHGLIERVTFVIGKDRRIAAVMSSRNDTAQKINRAVVAAGPARGGEPADQALTPDQHVDLSLAMVRRMASQ